MAMDTPNAIITPTLVDLQHIERAFRRADLLRRHSHGTFKRSAMAMINFYLKQAGQNFARDPHDLHPAM